MFGRRGSDAENGQPPEEAIIRAAKKGLGLYLSFWVVVALVLLLRFRGSGLFLLFAFALWQVLARRNARAAGVNPPGLFAVVLPMWAIVTVFCTVMIAIAGFQPVDRIVLVAVWGVFLVLVVANRHLSSRH